MGEDEDDGMPTPSRSSAPYHAPFGWWGPAWATPTRWSIVDLIRRRTLGADLGAILWALVARRASIAVVGRQAGAGKTTLLTALVDLLPAGTNRVYVRGAYEPFDFLGDPAVVPAETALLVNEISPHLPAYLWGEGVRRVLRRRRAGYAIYATAHAADAEGLVGLLGGPPLRVPLAEVAAFDLVVAMDAWRDDAEGLPPRPAGKGDIRMEGHRDTSGVCRQVGGVWCLAPTPSGGVVIDPVAVRAARGASPRLDLGVVASLTRRLAPTPRDLLAELSRRAGVLGRLAEGDLTAEEIGVALAAEHDADGD